MTKISSIHDYDNEKAIINALLKISKIIHKTETNRQFRKTKKHSKKTIGDGDFNENEHQQVPIPPPMRSMDSYVSGFNQNSFKKSRIYQQMSIERLKSDNLWNSLENNKQIDEISIEHSDKRYCSNNSFETSTNINNNPSAYVQISSMGDSLIQYRTDLNMKINDEFEIILENYLKNHFLSSRKSHQENIQKQRQIRFSSFTKSQTDKLINELYSSQSIITLDHYNKQRQLALCAVKQGNYTLSYSIYTNLLHEYSDYCQLKSDILSSRAMTLLLEKKYFESIDDCTQAIALNEWNKLAYVIRGACWMIKEEYLKAINDYSKLFHFFQQNQYILDLLNLAYENYQLSKVNKQSITSFIQPSIYLCYPYQTDSIDH